MTILVTGGAGYVGAHMLLALDAAGERAVALDDLSTGVAERVPASIPLIVGNCGDQALLAQVFRDYRITDVIHFAGSILVSEALTRPIAYYRNNVVNTLNLIEAIITHGIDRFIFSSTAAVYGKPDRIPVSETAVHQSLTAYGASMAMSERILADAARAHGLGHMVLRYFNVAGADPDLRAGEMGKPSHLIKVATQIAVGSRKEALQIYGSDYPTPDGTAIRDYIHVSDLADAHLSALSHLRAGGPSSVLNCGYGRGYSVHEVIDAVERVSGVKIPVVKAARREGDAPQLIADSAAIRTTLDWRPHYDDLDFIIRTAMNWERTLADGPAGATGQSR
ncbi:MAG: UDP-glucose 4-epimerase GalE [Pseudomonadota bacterium]